MNIMVIEGEWNIKLQTNKYIVQVQNNNDKYKIILQNFKKKSFKK